MTQLRKIPINDRRRILKQVIASAKFNDLMEIFGEQVIAAYNVEQYTVPEIKQSPMDEWRRAHPRQLAREDEGNEQQEQAATISN